MANFAAWKHRYSGQKIFFFDQGGPNQGLWNSANNWFKDSSGTVPLGRLPRLYDYIVILNIPVALTDIIPTLQITGFEIVDLTTTSWASLTITGTGSIYQHGRLRVSTGNWDGQTEAGADVRFNGDSTNSGTLQSDATFSDTAVNNGHIVGNIYCNSGASNAGTVDGVGQFLNNTKNTGTVGSNGTITGGVFGRTYFSGTTENAAFATVSGDAEFRGTSENNGNCLGYNYHYDSSHANDITGNSGYTFMYDTSTSNSWFVNGVEFHNSSQHFGGNGPAQSPTFYDTTQNWAGTNGPIFTGSSTQNGWSNDSTYMDQNAVMTEVGYSASTVECHGSASMGGSTQAGNGYFYDTSELNATGIINGDAGFNDQSNEFGTVTGTVTCNGTGTCTPFP